MSLKDQLKNVKLKKVETKEGRKGMEQICKDEEQQTKMMKLLSFEDYYELIKPFTFRTEIVELTDEEISGLIKEGHIAHKSNFQHTSWKENKDLQSISKKIEETLFNKMKVKAGFVRFNTLSPKDAIFVDEMKMLKELSLAMDSLKEDDLDYKDEFNKKIYALYIASTRAMRIEKGNEAVNLLINSKRTTHELKKYSEGKLKKPVLIIREFASFDVQYEFRAFVYKKKLVAISQYNPFCYFPKVNQEKKEIEKKIVDFFNEKILKDEKLMKFESFIVDVVLKGDDVYIVELNPYGEFAGSCLFEWCVPSDYKILLGKAPFEFRIISKVDKFVIHRIEKNYSKILSKIK